ncbi:MAG: PQQ-like beta-propeller repeat protein, partial [Gemmataceae bacterium]|nr:PQQ-like beta-propeller repeat protein [Gemmataceae bacterium]
HIGSYLVCVRAEPDSFGKLEPRWPPISAGGTARDSVVLFEGSPVVREPRLWIAQSRFNGVSVVTTILCYGTADGELRWQREVCETPRPGAAEVRHRHHLLTLAGRNVVYCSHSGAIVAVDAESGRWVWGARYPSRGGRTPEADPSTRDLAPCVYHEGRLYVAPADYDRVLCLDAATGRLIWESKPLEVVHLLGLTPDRLIVTTGSWPRGIRALDIATGRDDRAWLQPDDGSDLATVGRGFLAGGLVFWPTALGLRLLDEADGQPLDLDPTRLRHIPSGNMAFAGGCLAVATADELLIFPAPGRHPAGEPVPKPPRAEGPGPATDGVWVAARSPRNAAESTPFFAPLTAKWAVQLPTLRAGHVGQGSHDLLLFSHAGRLFGLDAATGLCCWDAPEEAKPTWVGSAGDLVLIAHPDGVQARDRSDGRCRWQIDQPGLSSFQAANGRLYALQQQRRLWAWDVATGQALWDRWAPGARLHLPPPRGRFHPHLRAIDGDVVVQTAHGRCWVLDGATGKLHREAATSTDPWPQPPLLVGNGRLAMVEGAEQVVVCDPKAEQPVSVYRPDRLRHPGLSGEPLQAIGRDDVLIVRVATNTRYGLECVACSTGRPRWPQPLRFPRDQALELSGAELDAEALYVVRGRTVHAYALADGRQLWSTSLAGPEAAWQLRRVGSFLLVHPRHAPPGMPLERIWREFGRQSWRHFWRTGWPVPPAADWRRLLVHTDQAHFQRSIDVWLIDVANGAVRQRWTFPAAGPAVAVVTGPQGLTVATAGRAWGLSATSTREN